MAKGAGKPKMLSNAKSFDKMPKGDKSKGMPFGKKDEKKTSSKKAK